MFWFGRHGDLTETEYGWAQTAWQYSVNNTDPNTGLVAGIDRYPTASMANIAEALASLHVAYQLEMVDDLNFDGRLSALLHFLNSMDLFDNKVPNRNYHTQTGKMVTLTGEPGQIGWSGLDIGRLLIWLNLYKRFYPAYGEYIDKAILRWDFCTLLATDGTIQSGRLSNGQLTVRQDGRLGFEEYAAYGYALWGFNSSKAQLLLPYQVFNLYDIPFLVDGHDPRVDGVPNPLVPTSFWLAGIEFNWDLANDNDDDHHHHSAPDLAQQAAQLYALQQARFEQDALHTARAEHILSSAPWFLYDAVWGHGSAFPSIADDGSFHDQLALVSTKATFLMWALWDTPYTDELMVLVEPLHDPQRGWFEGRYERSAGYEKAISLATNAAVLKSLLYKVQGKLMHQPYPSARLEVVRNNEFEHPGRCQPQ